MDTSSDHQVHQKGKFSSNNGPIANPKIIQDKNKSGCARTEGLVKYSWEEKLALRLKLYRKGELQGTYSIFLSGFTNNITR